MQHATLSAQKGYPEAAAAIESAVENTRTREIEREMVNLDVAAQSLNGALTALLDRLGPVMRLSVPKGEKVGDSGSRPTSSPLGSYLRTQSERMDSLADLLRDACERLELP